LKNKVFLLILATLVLLVVMGISSNAGSKVNWIGNVISVPLSPVQNFFSYVGQKIDDGLGFFKDISAVKEENERLKARVSELEQENRELAASREENLELREALNLKGIFDNYVMIGGNVIAKDAGNWFNIFKIDVGIKDGVSIGDGVEYPVLNASKGLVGRILTTDLTSSKVISLIDEDSAVSGWIAKPGGGHVIVKGDLSLKEKGLCRMDYIPVEVDVSVNDIIETSGLGGIYPKGIIIGKVVEIKKTSSELNKYAIIEPAVDFKKLEEVFVLKNKINDGNDSVEK
jgi:rod shape-determining protein MreC